MTHAPQSRASASRRRHRRGFTLMELIIVIGILVILMGLLIPILSMVNRQGQSTKTAATLSSIATALDSYRSDFGDYPRFVPGTGDPLNDAPDRGARLLARSLFGVAPAEEVDPDPSAPGYLFRDGHGTVDSPLGFKDRRQQVTRPDEDGNPTTAAYYPGPVHEPYLQEERFELRKTTDATLLGQGYIYGPDAVILDPANQQAILYYPALARQPNISDAARSNFVDMFDQNTVSTSLYNGFDNRGALDGTREGLGMPDAGAPPTPAELLSLRMLLGDSNDNGRIEPGETPATTAPYLLIAGGIDGFVKVARDPNASPPTEFDWYVKKPIANFQVTAKQ